MRLTVVGCAPAYTRRAGRASSCYLVESGEHALVLDLGQGAFAELSRYRAPESIGGVLISHLHPDHLVDLIPLRHYLKYGVAPVGGTPRPAIEVRGPAALGSRLDGLVGEAGFLAPMVAGVLAPGTFELAGFTVEAGHVTHIPDSYAFRITPAGGGPGLVYSGDCAVADDLLPLLRPADTLLCEAFFGAGPAGPMHLTAAQAASAAQRGAAARLVLTHVMDGAAEAATTQAAQAFAGPVMVAAPGVTLELA
jgi:ribonuclease BN (tRNA processing enzyme)